MDGNEHTYLTGCRFKHGAAVYGAAVYEAAVYAAAVYAAAVYAAAVYAGAVYEAVTSIRIEQMALVCPVAAYNCVHCIVYRMPAFTPMGGPMTVKHDITCWNVYVRSNLLRKHDITPLALIQCTA